MGFRPHSKLGYTDEMRNKGRFKVLTAVLMKIQVFWDVAPCRLVNNNRYFGGPQCFLPQSQAVLDELFFLIPQTSLSAWPWRWRHYPPPKCR